jgi:cytochrome c oxidase subunit IV
MQHMSHEQAIRLAYRGLVLLAVVTVIEVIISLFGKGYLGWKEAYYLTWVHYAAGTIITALSFYKAYYIVFNFMHLGMETRSLIRTVLLPLVLLIFAIIAFLWEGAYWHNSRSYIVEQNELKSDRVVPDIPATIEMEKIKNIH